MFFNEPRPSPRNHTEGPSRGPQGAPKRGRQGAPNGPSRGPQGAPKEPPPKEPPRGPISRIRSPKEIPNTHEGPFKKAPPFQTEIPAHVWIGKATVEGSGGAPEDPSAALEGFSAPIGAL